MPPSTLRFCTTPLLTGCPRGMAYFDLSPGVDEPDCNTLRHTLSVHYANVLRSRSGFDRDTLVWLFVSNAQQRRWHWVLGKGCKWLACLRSKILCQTCLRIWCRCHGSGNEIHPSCLPSSKPVAWPAVLSTLHLDWMWLLRHVHGACQARWRRAHTMFAT